MKRLKAVIAVVLAASLMLASLGFAASAQGEAGANGTPVAGCSGDCGHSPVVVVPGINHSPTYLYDENDKPVYNSDGAQIGGSLLIIDTDPLVKIILRDLLWPLVKMLVTQHDGGFSDAAYKVVKQLFSIQACDADGEMINNLKTVEYGSLASMSEKDREWAYRMVPMQKLTQTIGEDHTYFFTFNLVGNPMESAKKLHEYIQRVKTETGHDKVSLLNVSLGGTIFTAYLDLYGHGDLDEVVNAVAATDGSDIVADFFTRGEAGFRLEDEFVYHEFIPAIIEESMGSPTLGYLINILIRIIPKQVLMDTLTRAMDGILESMMLNCPQFWALVPSARYDALSQKYLSGSEHQKLKEKTDRYHEAQLRLRENVLAAHAQGVEINSIAGAALALGDVEYRYFGIVRSAETSNSDGIIQLSSTSMGATGAAPGQKLPKNYTPALKGYMSSDGTVDASTAVLPDNTWIFIGQHHEAGNNDVVLTLAAALFTDPELVDVHSKPDVWPQYNGACRTKELRRWLVPEGKAALAELEAKPAEERPSAEDMAELRAAIAEGEAVLNATIADSQRCEKASERLENILVKLGFRTAAEEPSALSGVAESVCALLSLAAVKTIGGSGFSDVLKACIDK